MIKIAVCDDDQKTVDLHNDIMEDGFFYDLLVLDIEMPGVTGMELSKKIKPYLPNIKIIFVTSHLEYAIDAFELSI